MFFSSRCSSGLEKVEGTYINDFKFVLLQWPELQFYPCCLFCCLVFFLFFRKNPNKIHLLIYVFTKHVNKKGRGTQGEIWWGTLCQVQDSRHHPLNISFTFAAEFIMPPECCRRKQRQCHYETTAASEAGWEQKKQAICNISACLYSSYHTC